VRGAERIERNGAERRHRPCAGLNHCLVVRDAEWVGGAGATPPRYGTGVFSVRALKFYMGPD
jgi:hypothetical protein